MFSVPGLVAFAIKILLDFLKTTIKNIDSVKAKQLEVVLTMLRDAINDFLAVFNHKFTPEGKFKE